ncbi:hypothetical protein L914_08817 [Phytophthora nicotianae]|uniref:Uncharacterized protein n=1 Tax=Phytophthora nicotianae TaxID=4792 RepID=W2NF08_PHYNI|nr:hypothetical protein L914_08817 [Phytophthora nicotianae]
MTSQQSQTRQGTQSAVSLSRATRSVTRTSRCIRDFYNSNVYGQLLMKDC